MAKYNFGDVVLLNPNQVTSTRGSYYAQHGIPLKITKTRPDGYKAIAIGDERYDGEFGFDYDRVQGLADDLALVRVESKKF